VSREPELAGQTVVVIGGSSGIGLETARRARSEGADVVLAGRNTERLERFFDELPTPIDHVMVTAGGPYYARLADIDGSQQLVEG
jgi:NAD(P)-dependent dehydrogenase (short-subunit alcohol dehydrogenase family)